MTDGKSVLMSGTHLGLATNFSPFSLIIFRQLTGLLMCALSDERSGL
jgi:hypothetical protein